MDTDKNIDQNEQNQLLFRSKDEYFEVLLKDNVIGTINFAKTTREGKGWNIDIDAKNGFKIDMFETNYPLALILQIVSGMYRNFLEQN
jgi:hypothetical protein